MPALITSATQIIRLSVITSGGVRISSYPRRQTPGPLQIQCRRPNCRTWYDLRDGQQQAFIFNFSKMEVSICKEIIEVCPICGHGHATGRMPLRIHKPETGQP